MAKRRYFSGDSLEQAVLEAAGHHGLEPEQVAWRQIEKRHGFLRVRRNVVIEVDPESPRGESPSGREEAGAAAEPSETPAQSGTPVADAAADREPTPAAVGPEPTPAVVEPEPTPAAAAEAASSAPAPESPAGGAAAAEAGASERQTSPRGAVSEAEVREALELLLELSDLAVDPHVKAKEGSISVDLRGPEEEFLREEEGEVLKVLEHVALRMLGAAEGRIDSFRIDSAGFREERDEKLRRRAVEAAQEVGEGTEPRLLEPMGPADRRVVHLAVEAVPGVTTRSQGRGDEKRVLIVREGE